MAVAMLVLLAPQDARSARSSGHAAPGPAQGEAAGGRVIDADPSSYLRLLQALKPGDTLRLAPGIYDPPGGPPGLPVFDMHGTADAPITISGPASGPRAIFIGAARHNTIRIANASHVVLRDLDIDARDRGGDGVNGQGPSHHITLDGLSIRGVGGSQQVVGISTNRAPAWNWIIRRTTIIGAGTGMYLGNSDGANPFVNGLIEHNLIVDSLGYNLQVKHQAPWPEGAGLPTDTTHTVIRHNVFSKQRNSSGGAMARPNLLVGDVPSTGPGKDNGYRIYGNFFYQNPTEALFQGEGNVAFYSNLLVNDAGPGILMRRHNGSLREALVFGNTIVSSGPGITLRVGHPAYRQRAIGNAVFSGDKALVASDASHNLVDRQERAPHYLRNPLSPLPALDLKPRGSEAAGAPVDADALGELPDVELDFDGRRRDWSYRGAYTGGADDARWTPQLAIKP